jgi:hypothetical protein
VVDHGLAMAMAQARFDWQLAPNARSTLSGATYPRRFEMSEPMETLKKARERMVEDRDAFAKVLAAPFDRDKAERARVKFVEIQALIDAIERAIEGEKT